MKNIGFLCPYTPKIHPKIYPKYLKFLLFLGVSWPHLVTVSLHGSLHSHPSIPIKIPKKSLGFLWHGEGKSMGGNGTNEHKIDRRDGFSGVGSLIKPQKTYKIYILF